MNLINNKYFKSTIKSYKKLFIYIIICLSFYLLYLTVIIDIITF
ncbi:hypothetical protein CNEO_40323 [Clostridium neonatale]|uniref:Uncharacterized protein n=1 Tax=Clostridium neonatale TaxID=137838 RepID=A0AA86MQR2_9CLOT|nr:hypothetical protein CNEO_40323 [Clostridium neonatale]